ncbi:MAG: flagellar hook-length control protein FliK [Deltaproteobacteria bacterium]|nr:flagellar hook-length control protein FliK [Deltaproteobacteria bacterium]
MQPELLTDFQMIINQQGNTAIGPKGDSLKGDNEINTQDKCFLGMLNDMEKISDENILDTENLQKKIQNDASIPGMGIKNEQEVCSLIGDMILKGENIAEILLGPEQNSKGNEANTLSPKTEGKDLLKGQIIGNEKVFRIVENFGNKETEKNAIDKNVMATVLKVESDSDVKKATLSEKLNVLVEAKENESKTGQKELKDNNAGILISKDSKGVIGKKTGVQLLKGFEGDIAKTIKKLETKSIMADVPIKDAADIKDVEKTGVTGRILMEGATDRIGVKEAKKDNSSQIINGEIKDSSLSKKDFLLRIFADIKEKEQGADPSKGDDASDEKSSHQNKEFINLNKADFKIKASGSEFSEGKMHNLESTSKDNGIILPKNISGDKSSEEIVFGKEYRASSNISRDGTLNQIVEKAALSLKNGKSEARVELKPEFLGSVRMKITTENHLVRVRILTELPVVKEMIENNISQLKTDLQSQGLQIDKLDVSVANDSQQHGKSFEETELLSEKENSDVSDDKAVTAEETETVDLLKESTADNGLDFFA